MDGRVCLWQGVIAPKAGDRFLQADHADRGPDHSYISFKGALCYQSDPLVEVIRKMLDHFFGISLMIDDKCIEDACAPG